MPYACWILYPDYWVEMLQAVGWQLKADCSQKELKLSAGKLKDIMPKRPRYYDGLPEKLRDKLAKVYQALQDVPYINKQHFDKWQERFCYSPEPEREIAIWEWLAKEYEEQTASLQNQREKNRIFKRLLSKSVDYEPLGVKKLPEWGKGTGHKAQGSRYV